MTGRMRIEFQPAEGAVVRLIGLIERRGFQVRGLGMAQEDDDRASLVVELDARDPTRSLQTLDLQLRRIQGVRNISIFTPAAGAVA